MSRIGTVGGKCTTSRYALVTFPRKKCSLTSLVAKAKLTTTETKYKKITCNKNQIVGQLKLCPDQTYLCYPGIPFLLMLGSGLTLLMKFKRVFSTLQKIYLKGYPFSFNIWWANNSNTHTHTHTHTHTNTHTHTHTHTHTELR